MKAHVNLMKHFSPYLAVILAYSMATAPMAAAQDAVRDRVQALQDVPEVPAIPEGPDRIESLPEGQRAPYTGMLLDTDTAIRWTNALRWWPEAFRLRVQLLGAIHEETVASYERRLTLVEESYTREIEGLRQDVRDVSQRLADAMTREWYETVGFGVVVGVVISAVIVALGGGLAIGLLD